MSVSMHTAPPLAPVSTPTVEFSPARASLTLVLSDVHYEERWLPLWSGLLEWLREYGADLDRVLINGDWFNFESVSLHGGVAQPRTLAEDLADGKAGLADVVGLTPNASHLFHGGNHDRWPEKYIANRAPALHGLFDLRELLGLKELGIEYVPGNEQPTRSYGRLRAIHGDQIMGGGGVVVAKTLFDKGFAEAGYTTLIGHFHKWSAYTREFTSGDAIACSLPTMGAPQPRYTNNAHNNWTHGFTLVETLGSLVRVEPVIASRHGQFLYRGRIFGGTP